MLFFKLLVRNLFTYLFIYSQFVVTVMQLYAKKLLLNRSLKWLVFYPRRKALTPGYTFAKTTIEKALLKLCSLSFVQIGMILIDA